MGAFSKVIVPKLGNFLQSIKNKAELPKEEQKTVETRLNKFIEENPELLNIYDRQQIYDAFVPYLNPETKKLQPSQVGVMAPRDFGKAASPLPFPDKSKIETIQNLIDQETPISYTPFLNYEVVETPDGPKVMITGHQGRHRNLVLGSKNYPYGVLKFNPNPKYVDPIDQQGALYSMQTNQPDLKTLPPDTPVYSQPGFKLKQDFDFEEGATFKDIGTGTPENIGSLSSLVKLYSAPVATVTGLSVGSPEQATASNFTGQYTESGRPVYFLAPIGYYSEITRTIPLTRTKDGKPAKNTKWVNVPSVFEGGRIEESEKKLSEFYEQNGYVDPITGENLEIFDSESDAISFAKSRSDSLMKEDDDDE